SQSGIDLINKLNMGQYDAPKQKTPSDGFHYLFYVDAQQKGHITARTTITYQGAVYNMDVKFNNGLCNCAPSNIEGYGKYAWTDGSAARLRDIPHLPDEFFEMIKVAPQPTPTTTTTITTTKAQGSLRRPQQGGAPPQRSCRISRLSVVASPCPSL
ncbi:MAG: hypothetical protein ACKPKO_56440, partial [Candidatus Fonsibacter sp.]